MICPICRYTNQAGVAFCTQCGTPTRKPVGKAKRIFKWTGIGCGSLLGLLIVLIIVAAIASSGNDGNVGTVPSSNPSSQRAVLDSPKPLPTLTFEEQKSLANQVSYDDLFRNNESHVGKQVWYEAKVIQVVEGRGDDYQLRANVTRGDYSWDDTVFLYYSGPRVLEDDVIEFVGMVEELKTYKAVFGQPITIPAIRVITSRLVPENGVVAATLVPTEPPTPIPPIAASADLIPTTLAPTAGPTPTLPPTPTPTPLPPGLSLDSPLETGEVLKGPNGVEIVVTGIMDDAAHLLTRGEGNRIYMIHFAFAFLSANPDASLWVSPDSFDLIGDGRVVYDSSHSCGSTITALSGEVFAGGRIEGSVCFEVPETENNMVLIYQPGYSGDRQYVKLDPINVGSRDDLTAAKIGLPGPANSDSPPGLTLTNPVKIGGTLEGTDGTEIVVRTINADAWAQLGSRKQYLRPPMEGQRYYLISAEVSNVLPNGPVHVAEHQFDLVGDHRIGSSSDSDACGGYWRKGGSAFSAEIYPGGKVEFEICFSVLGSDDHFVLIHQPERRDSRRFLAID